MKEKIEQGIYTRSDQKILCLVVSLSNRD